jgi:hypothetical protein
MHGKKPFIYILSYFTQIVAYFRDSQNVCFYIITAKLVKT